MTVFVWAFTGFFAIIGVAIVAVILFGAFMWAVERWG